MPPSPKPVTFDVVAAGSVRKTEGHRAEDLTPAVYKLHVEEARAEFRTDVVDLVPQAYLELLLQPETEEHVSFTESRWAAEMAGRVPAAAATAMFPFQREAVWRMVAARRCLNACSMGLGKSMQALCALWALRDGGGRRGDVIICPGYLRHNWTAEVRRWLGPDVSVTVITSGAKARREASLRALLYGPGIKVVSYDMAASLFGALKRGARGRAYFNTVICDESHFLKDDSTKRFTMLAACIRESANVFLLSGTPSPNRPRELFAQFSLVRPDVFRARRTFTDRYCAGHEDNFGRYDDRGLSHAEELAHLCGRLVLRMRREDHLPAGSLPTWERHRVELAPAGRSAKFEAQMCDFRRRLAQADEDWRAAGEAQALASAMFRETAAMKAGPVVEYVEGLVAATADSGEKTILFCVHRSILDAVAAALPAGEFVAISGKTAMAARPGLIERFLSDPGCRFALLTVGSCATGLNMVPVASMVFLELCWTPTELSQCEARICRIGAAPHLSFTYLTCAGTLDDVVFNKLARKNDQVVAVIDGGVDYGDFAFNEPTRALI